VLAGLLLGLGLGGFILAAEDVFHLEHADRLRHVTYGDVPVRELIGNVRVNYGELTIDCERARHNVQQGKLVCRGSVQVTHHDRVLNSNELTYFEMNNRVEAFGNVRIREDSLRGECVRGIYWRDTEQLQMEQQAQLEDLEREVLLTADLIDYDHRTGLAWSRSRPVLRARHASHGNVKVLAEYMELQRPEHQELAAGDVRIQLKETTATCDTFIYCDTSAVGRMIGNPLLVHQGRQIRGELINLELAGELLEAVSVFGQGVAEVPADSLDSRLINSFSGDTLFFDFTEGELRSMTAVQEANSVYFGRDDDGQPGLNLAAGDLIVLEMDSTSLRAIEVQGGSQGRYLPLREPLPVFVEENDGQPESD